MSKLIWLVFWLAALMGIPLVAGVVILLLI